MNKHKHYQQIRAFADGWEIEYFTIYNEWEKIYEPTFLPTRQYHIVPDAEGWLPWYGGECPVGLNDFVTCEFRKGNRTDVAKSFCWTDETENPIIRYEIVKAAPKPKVKMWQWVLQSGAGKVFTTTNFYTSSTDVSEIYCDCKIIKKADWTEIEVDDA